MGFLCAVGIVATGCLIYKVLSALWVIVYPHMLAKRLGHLIDLKTLGSWAVVTGATDGIGKGYAKCLAKRGLNVVLISRNQQRLDDTAQEINLIEPKVQVKTLVVDFEQAVPETYRTKINDALKDLEIGILINNVGMSYAYPEVLTKVRGGEDTFQGLIAVNCSAAVQLTNLLLPSMLGRDKGAIVNISSVTGLVPSPYLSVYSASKAFVDYFTRSLRHEYSESGVIFQVVFPCLVNTKMSGSKKQSFFAQDPDKYAESALDTIGIVDITAGCLPHEIEGQAVKMMPPFLASIVFKRAMKAMRAKFLRREQQEQKSQ